MDIGKVDNIHNNQEKPVSKMGNAVHFLFVLPEAAVVVEYTLAHSLSRSSSAHLLHKFC